MIVLIFWGRGWEEGQKGEWLERFEEMEDGEEDLSLTVRWNGGVYDVKVGRDGTFGELKEMLRERTGVQPHRQKIVGLGVKLVDENKLVELNWKKKILLIGTREEEIEKVVYGKALEEGERNVSEKGRKS